VGYRRLVKLILFARLQDRYAASLGRLDERSRIELLQMWGSSSARLAVEDNYRHSCASGDDQRDGFAARDEFARAGPTGRQR